MTLHRFLFFLALLFVVIAGVSAVHFQDYTKAYIAMCGAYCISNIAWGVYVRS